MVEAAGQLSNSFEKGWTMPSSRQVSGCGAYYSQLRILVFTLLNLIKLGEAMSLYRASLRLALYLPLGVATCRLPKLVCSNADRFHRCELRFHLTFTDKRDHFDRTRVRKSSAVGTTCLGPSLILQLRSDGQGV